MIYCKKFKEMSSRSKEPSYMVLSRRKLSEVSRTGEQFYVVH